jgi:hypothetical protein
LRSVDGFDLDGIISFDEALRRAGQEDGFHADADSVRVILGSANADQLHWGKGKRLYYGIDWAGVCIYPISHGLGYSPPPGGERCMSGTWGTVIDARTGEFIVSGN